jgi:O-succinylbenzoic acid--CoA ligase
MRLTLARVTARTVRPLPVAGGAAALEVLPALRRALDGDGPALRPVSAGASVEGLADEVLAPGEDDAADPTVLVVSTSGSTGDPKAALLSRTALLASATATHRRLDGPGSWLLALPAQHIAGLQVLVRSLVAGTTPIALDSATGFSPNAFAAATAELDAVADGGPRYTSLVPTQLHRLLEAGGAGQAALTSYDAVLVGGSAVTASLLERATAAGAIVVTTYGMSETCGGCVYDGRPLPGVWWRTEDDGRVELTGAVLARGYRGRPDDPAFRIDPDGTRWFRTDDIGEAEPDGALRVLGRQDDVIVTGGLKVAPALVEAALAGRPDIREVVVVGVPDEGWGERIVAVVVPRSGAVDQAAAAQCVSEQVASYAAPRDLVLVDEIPLIGPGKPDRAAVRGLAVAATAGG